MRISLVTRTAFTAIWLTVLLTLVASVNAAPPDLTAVDLTTINRTLTYNLGPTGLRGWIYIGGGNGADGTITTESRQILVTVASAPGDAVLAVDDVILGAMAGSSGTVPLFASDARKAFGGAIGDAEKTGAGTLRVKRWRAGTITDENIPMTIMGDYTATAPYSCPKSALILANARTKLVGQLKANANFLTSDWSGAISGLALLAGVSPGDPDYATVQTRLQTYARARATAGPQPGSLVNWDWGYLGLFLAEYYLSTGDANVLSGINKFSLALAQSQSIYGTFGHSPSVLRPDGSGRRMGIGYGPVNQVGIVANTAIVMGRKALVAGAQTVDPQIDAAIQRGSDFFAWYVNKGPIPYGEHEPFMDGHSSNGKDPLCAVLFGLQAGRTAETEYYSRMTTASFTGREYGHTGQGFSYLWSAMGANMGGSLAVAEYLKPVRWHLDLSRRTDGSFVYDGAEQYGAGETADDTYLGASGYYGMNATASYILTYALPLQRLYITGKNAIPANTLDASKVANAIAAATFKQDCPAFTYTQLIAALSEYDPVVRHYAAIELGKRTPSPTELATLRNMVTGPDANDRMAACQALGLLKDATALPSITQRLDKSIETNSWVRAKAASAIRSYTPATASSYRDPMLTAYTANATDPDVIVWDDPIQISNNYLSFALFGDAVYGGNNLSTYTINAAKSLLYPAVQAGLKQPDSISRSGAAKFCYDKLPLADVQALIPDFFKVIEIECLADRMWGASPRASGIKTLAKYKVSEGIPLALAMLEIPAGFEWGSDEVLIAGLNALAAYGDASRWTLPTLRGYLGEWSPTSTQYTTLVNTIASIENAITAATQVPGLAVANSQVVVTTGAKAITLTGASPRTSVTFTNVTAPAHGTLTGTAPNLTYTPTTGYTGPDFFTFQTTDGLTTSAPGTVSIIVGIAGTGLKGEYFDNMDFTNLKLTRTDAQVNFDWGTGSPNAAIGADTFSVRWSGLLLVPETGTYTFSTLNSDGARLYVNGVPVSDDYVDQATNWKDGASINLTAGQMVDLQLEYYENTGSAVAKLKWTGPSFAGANGLPIAKEWLYDGTGVANRTPYAHAQSLTLIQNTAQPVTLTGSGGTLTYAVIAPPGHGTLTGTAPNLTYTPAANFSGSDSFTFLVNNGTSNSTPATVSIGVWAGPPVDFFWATAAAGNWSGAAAWSNAAGATVLPVATGQALYRMSFNKSGTYTATQDLNTGFLLNQLNLAGTVTLAGTNSLAFVANGTLLPQFNQNSTSTVTVSIPVSLAAMTSFGGSNGGSVLIEGLVSGAGGLTKDNAGMLKLYGLSPNPYSGGTIVNSGTLHLGTMVNGISPLCANPVGTGMVTLNGGTIELERVSANNLLTMNGGTLYSNNGWGASWTGPITLNSTATVNVAWPLTCSGNISGVGGFILTGGRTLTLSGTNSFTGANRITAGTLTCSKSAALGTGSLDITTDAKVNLNFTGTRVIAALTFNAGAAMPPGTYGSTSSPATNKSDTYFAGTGTVTILPATTTALALTGGSTPSDPGTPLTFTATVTGASPTGNVAFYAGSTLLGTSALNGSFQASFTTGSLAIGSHSITAIYAGNATNAASTSAGLAIEVTSLLPAAPTNLFAAPGNNQIALTWTVSVGAASYYVKRALTNGGPYTVIGNPNTASYNDSAAINGTTYYYVVSAINGAGESANSAQLSAIPAVLPSNTTVTSSLGNAGTYGAAVTFTATVAVSGGPATGTVTFMDGATVLGTGALDGSGQASHIPGTLAAGSHSITASYGGDTAFGASVSPAFSYTVNAKPVTLAGMSAANKEYDGTTAAVLTGGTVTGLESGDTVTVVAGTATFASPNVGTWAVTVTGCSLGGGSAGNYVLPAQPTVANASITARPVVLTGTRIYDGTTAAAGWLIANNLDGPNLTVTGSAELVGKDVGSQAILVDYVTPVRVRSATGSTGTSSKTTFSVTLSAGPVAGNTLVAVISTRGTSDNRVSSIAQTGANWTRAAQATNAGGTTIEIWIAPNVAAGTGTAITITQASLRSAAVVVEYSGVLAASPLDRTNGATGSSTAAVTGTTAITTQANELWLGGIGIADGRRTLDAPYGNAFAVAASAQSGTTNSDAMSYALEKMVNATGSASSSGTVSSSDAWSGVIATFKAASTSALALAGPAAGNYTLAGLTGAMTITPKALTVTGLTASGKVYDGTSAAVVGSTAAFLTPEAAGAGSTGDGKPYDVDAVTPGGTAAGAFADPNVGTAKSVAVTGVTVTGTGSGNYTIMPPAGLTADLTPRALDITANHQSKTYGQTLTFGSGSAQFESSGLQQGETIGSVTLACDGGAAAAEVAGSPYPITPTAATGGTFAAGNYTINYVTGLLTVNPADQTIAFGSLAGRTMGDAPFELTATASSGLTVGYVSSDPSVAFVAGNIVTMLQAGSTILTASQPGDANFKPATPVAWPLIVSAMNHPPVAIAQSVSTAEEAALAITLTASDADGDALTYVIATQPAHGTLSGTAPNVSYAPTTNYHGPDSFTFKANDGSLDSATAIVSLTITPVNDAPVAVSQSVNAGQDAATAITLSARDVDGDPLTYVIVSQPAHGTLSGTPPEVIYTSITGYSGVDSFTFKATDGTIDSAPATVTLTVVAVGFTWSNGVTGNWSDPSKWSSTSPPAAGNSAYVFNFNVAGTFTSTHNLSAGFLLNQLNFGGSTATLAGNSLAFSANGSTLPQLNQNSAVTVVVGNNLVLGATTTVGGTGTGTATLSGTLSGTGGLTKIGSCTWTLTGTNTYGGPTLVSAGTLRVTKPAAFYNAVEANWTPANLTVADGATLRLYVGGASDFTPAQAAMLLGNLSTVNHNGLLAGSYFGFDTLNAAALTTTISGSIADSSGPGGGAVGLKKYSNGVLLLGGANTYSGKTFIEAGTLSVASLNSVNGGGPPLASISLGRPVTVATGTIDFGTSGSPVPGILLYTGTGETTDRVMNFAGQAATNTFEQAGTGLLKFTSPFTITGSGFNKIIVLKGSTTGSGEIAGAISDPAVGKTTSLTKSGTGTWTLSGANTFSGATKVQAGTLVCTSGSSPGTGTLDLTTGAKLQLDYPGTRQVAALTFNAGSPQPNGSYGSSASAASNKNDAYFSGPGTVTVGPVITNQFALTVAAAPANGGSVTGGGVCELGALQPITATANSGWQFTGWTGAGITASGAPATTVLVDGDKTVTAIFTALVGYASWASAPAQGLSAGVNDGPADDPDHDGIANLLEFALGGAPLVSWQAMLPVLTQAAGVWVFEYERSHAALSATTQVVEYGSGLTGWTAVPIPAVSNGNVTITPGNLSDHVKVTLPAQEAYGFVRLKVNQ